MKKLLKSLFVILAVAATVSGATYAAWTARTQVKGNTFSTGNADLKIWDKRYLGQGWRNNLYNLKFENVHPNWTQDYSLKVKNNGSVDLGLTLQGMWEGGSDSKRLRNHISVQVWKFDDTGNYYWNGESTTYVGKRNNLEGWTTNPLELGELPAGEEQWYLLRFTADDFGDEFQSYNMSGYNFVFDGTTAGVEQPETQPMP